MKLIIQLSTSYEWQSAAIRWATRSHFSHGDFVLGDGSLVGASDSPQAPVLEGNPAGVARRPWNYQNFKYRHRIMVETDRAVLIEALALEQLYKPFDHEALKMKYFFADQFFERNWRDPAKWYCMEMILWCCEQKRLFPWKLAGDKARITGTDLVWIFNPLMDVDKFHQPYKGI